MRPQHLFRIEAHRGSSISGTCSQAVGCAIPFSLLVQRKGRKERTLRRGRFRFLSLLRTSLIETAKGVCSRLAAVANRRQALKPVFCLRGCGAEKPPVSATGSGCFSAPLDSPGGGNGEWIVNLTRGEACDAVLASQSGAQKENLPFALASAKRSGSARKQRRQPFPRLHPGRRIVAGTMSPFAKTIPALAPFSLWSARTVSLFGQVPKREMGLDLRRRRLANKQIFGHKCIGKRSAGFFHFPADSDRIRGLPGLFWPREVKK